MYIKLVEYYFNFFPVTIIFLKLGKHCLHAEIKVGGLAVWEDWHWSGHSGLLWVLKDKRLVRLQHLACIQSGKRQFLEVFLLKVVFENFKVPY